ncbi:methyltransferase domain-containing protein [Aquicoccus sp. G2-2]|uniref:class I SAM-dependent methyltransferase n=1 Tax=Aquicoccus sp. G2-2 TaxID=3092120 RepID=UPI002ADFA150|nr:class I SAM-dependent methyltransferase [Aquicoccus sp. G2-2]MEA1113814.1 class I SAM-dependent methyltransferase [Aquicoccus sp. G2-2]
MTGAAFWDGMAKRYAASPIRDVESYEYTLGRTRSYLGPDDKVLELGCGSGSTALRLADAAGDYVASDYAPAMVEIGRRKAAEAGVPNLRFEVAGAETPPNGAFDAVLAFNLLHLVDDLDAALAAIAARVVPGGLFISKTTCLAEPGKSLGLSLLLMALPVARWLGKAPRVQFHTIARLDAAIETAGFDIAETGNHPAKPPSRYVVARRRG